MAAWLCFVGGLVVVEAQGGVGEGLKWGPCACPLPTACTRVSSKAPAPPCQQFSCHWKRSECCKGREGTAWGEGGWRGAIKTCYPPWDAPDSRGTGVSDTATSEGGGTWPPRLPWAPPTCSARSESHAWCSRRIYYPCRYRGPCSIPGLEDAHFPVAASVPQYPVRDTL